MLFLIEERRNMNTKLITNTLLAIILALPAASLNAAAAPKKKKKSNWTQVLTGTCSLFVIAAIVYLALPRTINATPAQKRPAVSPVSEAGKKALAQHAAKTTSNNKPASPPNTSAACSSAPVLSPEAQRLANIVEQVEAGYRRSSNEGDDALGRLDEETGMAFTLATRSLPYAWDTTDDLNRPITELLDNPAALEVAFMRQQDRRIMAEVILRSGPGHRNYVDSLPLLRRYGNVNATNIVQQTPLQIAMDGFRRNQEKNPASARNYLNAVQGLVNAGADVNVRTAAGITLLEQTNLPGYPQEVRNILINAPQAR